MNATQLKAAGTAKADEEKYPLYGKKLKPATSYKTEFHAIEGLKQTWILNQAIRFTTPSKN